MRRLSENEKKHRDMPHYVSGQINGQGGSDKLKASLYHFVKILKDKNDRKEAQRKLNKNIRSIVDVLEDVYNIVENASYDQKLESPTEIPLGQSLSSESENVDYDVSTFTGSDAETLKKVLLRFYSKYLYIGSQIKHGDQVQQFEYNKRHILKDLDIFINMQLMKLDDYIQNENMKKVIKLTESDLTRIVKRVIKESRFEDDSYETEMFNVTTKDCNEPKKGNVFVTADGIAYIEYCRGDREELQRLKKVAKEKIQARFSSYNDPRPGNRFNNPDMY